MKPLIFLHTLDITLDGGVERVVCNMANYFIRHDYRVTILSTFQQNNRLKYDFDNRITFYYVFPHVSFDNWKKKNVFIKGQLLQRYSISFSIARRIYKYIDNNTCQSDKKVILCNDYLHVPFYGHKNTTLIGIDHSRYPYGSTRGFMHWLRTFYVHNALNIVTTLNPDEKGKWESLGRPVFVIPNFLPNNEALKEHNDNRQKTILSIGRMNTEQKGFDRLIDAYSLIAKKHQDWKLKIFGSGCFQKKYIDKVTELGLNQYIEIHDFTSDPFREYTNASIYAMCSREEGFPMVLLEAGCQGLPIISYDIQFGPRTLIKDTVTGYIVPDGDKVKFAESLEKLMIDEKLREKMSEEILKDIPARFSEKVIMDKWIKIINSI